MNDNRAAFPWYLAGIVSQYIPLGIHNVLFTWIIAVYLGESGVRLGIAQMMSYLPALVFILFGGLLADRIDRRKIIIAFHGLATLPVFVLALGIGAGYLNYTLMLFFALAVGALNAFIQPARDSLLNQVAGSNLQRAVTLAMGLTFGAQIIGYGIASQADAVGPAPLLLAQGLLLLVGSACALKLPSFTPTRQARAASGKSALGDIRDGIALIFGSERMAPVMILMFAVGIFYMGSFSVLNPLVVRDVYDGAAADIALSFICFMMGTILTTIILVSVGGVRHQGLGLMLALLIGGGCLVLTNLRLPFYGYLMCIGLWGMCGGAAMSLGRSIIQETAPEEYRARAMSIYVLGSLGGAPLGAVLLGLLSVALGPLESYLVAVTGVALIVACVWVWSDISRVDRLQPSVGTI